MTFDEYNEYDFQKAWQRQWHQSLVQQSRGQGIFDSLFRMHMKEDGVFGSGLIDIRPSGTAEIILVTKAIAEMILLSPLSKDAMVILILMKNSTKFNG